MHFEKCCLVCTIDHFGQYPSFICNIWPGLFYWAEQHTDSGQKQFLVSNRNFTHIIYMPYNKNVSQTWDLMILKTYNLFSNLFQNFQLRTTVFQTIFCMRSNPSANLLLSMLTNSFEATPPLYLLPLNNGLSSTYKARYTIPLLLFSYKGMAQHSLQ